MTNFLEEEEAIDVGLALSDADRRDLKIIEEDWQTVALMITDPSNLLKLNTLKTTACCVGIVCNVSVAIQKFLNLNGNELTEILVRGPLTATHLFLRILQNVVSEVSIREIEHEDLLMGNGATKHCRILKTRNLKSEQVVTGIHSALVLITSAVLATQWKDIATYAIIATSINAHGTNSQFKGQVVAENESFSVNCVTDTTLVALVVAECRQRLHDLSDLPQTTVMDGSAFPRDSSLPSGVYDWSVPITVSHDLLLSANSGVSQWVFRAPSFFFCEGVHVAASHANVMVVFLAQKDIVIGKNCKLDCVTASATGGITVALHTTTGPLFAPQGVVRLASNYSQSVSSKASSGAGELHFKHLEDFESSLVKTVLAVKDQVTGEVEQTGTKKRARDALIERGGGALDAGTEVAPKLQRVDSGGSEVSSDWGSTLSGASSKILQGLAKVLDVDQTVLKHNVFTKLTGVSLDTSSTTESGKSVTVNVRYINEEQKEMVQLRRVELRSHSTTSWAECLRFDLNQEEKLKDMTVVKVEIGEVMIANPFTVKEEDEVVIVTLRDVNSSV